LLGQSPPIFSEFLTKNFQGLLNNGTPYQIGATVPKANLEAIGVQIPDFFSTGFVFNKPAYSSYPGIKVLQLNKSDNNDLVALMSNPYLTQQERNFYYLNSLDWYTGGQQNITVVNTPIVQQNQDWYSDGHVQPVLRCIWARFG
jgi:hypothetical protein